MASNRESQLASAVLMIRPTRFESNPCTAASNRFQGRNPSPPAAQQQAAAREFEQLAEALRNAGVRVIVIDDTPEPHTPDAIFPNNWVSFHANGTVVLYPMEAPNRRTERRRDVIEALARESGYQVSEIVDLSHHEQDGYYLEGTGSLVLDRVNHIAYACRASRTHEVPLEAFSERMNYSICAFDAFDRNGDPIYHTNVMMMIGEEIAVICDESITDEKQRTMVLESLENSGHTVISLTFDQMDSFAGNMLELRSSAGESVIAMSQQAHDALGPDQVDMLTAKSRIVSAPIENIESSAGGSVRCMLAEIHLPSVSDGCE